MSDYRHRERERSSHRRRRRSPSPSETGSSDGSRSSHRGYLRRTGSVFMDVGGAVFDRVGEAGVSRLESSGGRLVEWLRLTRARKKSRPAPSESTIQSAAPTGVSNTPSVPYSQMPWADQLVWVDSQSATHDRPPQSDVSGPGPSTHVPHSDNNESTSHRYHRYDPRYGAGEAMSYFEDHPLSQMPPYLSTADQSHAEWGFLERDLGPRCETLPSSDSSSKTSRRSPSRYTAAAESGVGLEDKSMAASVSCVTSNAHRWARARSLTDALLDSAACSGRWH